MHRFRLSRIFTSRPSIHKPSTPQKLDAHTLLLQSGIISQHASGYFHLLPLGLRVKSKLESLIDKHMNRIGASKAELSSLCDPDLWRRSGRMTPGKDSELITILDRRKSGFVLSPTHEESVCALVKPYIQSYRDLPLRIYQTSKKYRDELRPRQGLLRAKEFYMKDLYTFDTSTETALKSYELVRGAYNGIFDEIGINYLTAVADSGSIGGNLNHEYHYVSDVGEDVVWQCPGCGYTANDEVIVAHDQKNEGCKCPKCSRQMTSNTTIEVGHTFFLGTRYSQPLGLRYQPERPDSALETVQMGCYGIGVSRLIAAMTTVLLPDNAKGLHWPRKLAPFEVAIIADDKVLSKAEEVYDLFGGDRDVVIDDRAEKLGWKLQRAELVGYPVVVVIGRAWEAKQMVEVRCNRTGVVSDVKMEDLRSYVEQLSKA